MSDFVHLHLHSEYSLLDGACRIAEIPRMAKAAGHKAVAITDHGVMYGAVDFYKACVQEGIQPIIGCEVYLAEASRLNKIRTQAYFNSHLILLVKNQTGYQNLIYMVSKSFTEGFYVKPRIDMELLREHHEGLICLSGCLSGRISKAILQNDIEEAVRFAAELKGLFGDDFYIELQRNGIEEQEIVNKEALSIARKLDIPIVATNDVHYLKKSDAETQAVLLAIQTNTKLSDPNAMGFATNDFYYRSTEEMNALFRDLPEALENTVRIAEKCQFDFVFGKNQLPVYPLPENTTPKKFLEKLTYEGLENKIRSGEITFDDTLTRDDYKARILYELLVISNMGYDQYYLIVWDFVNYARSHGIAVGPGRGSGAGSLVAYLIGITEVDSLRYHLLFERFLNPERISMPDFDIDFGDDKRDAVIEYVTQKYGSDRVSQIITFGTLAAKQAIRDVGRVMDMPYAEVDKIVKMLNNSKATHIDELMTDELRTLCRQSAKVNDLIEKAKALEGMPRNISTHAAGVIITAKPLTDYVPLTTSGDVVLTQFNMTNVEALGLLKFDFLALRNLTIIDRAEKIIRRSEPEFRIQKIPTDDAVTLDLIAKGQTAGVFQLESAGLKRLLSKMKPRNIEEVTLAISLYRPGPMESIPRYLENREHPERISYKIPQLKEILDDTSGIIIYQEQVMQICRKVAGFSYGKADIIRRAMAKKKADGMEKERADFLKGAKANLISQEDASALFDEMAGFAKYAFNKSHAASYAFISYRTAYLKAHYPLAYYASLLSSVMGRNEKIAEYINECAKQKIRVLPPDINESGVDFSVSGDAIRFGLAGVKQIGTSLVENILAERRFKPFASYLDFNERMLKYGITKAQLIALISVGAFDALGIERNRLLTAAEELHNKLSNTANRNLSGQTDLFSQLEEDITAESGYVFPSCEPLTAQQKLRLEKECIGIYLSGNLLDDYSDDIAALQHLPITKIHAAFNEESEEYGTMHDKDVVSIVGIVSKITRKNTKSGEVMAFVTVDDYFGEIELIVFPKLYLAYRDLFTIDQAIAVNATVTSREDEAVKLIVQSLRPLKLNAAAKQTAGSNLSGRVAPAEAFANSKTQPTAATRTMVTEKSQQTPTATRINPVARSEAGTTVHEAPPARFAARPAFKAPIEEVLPAQKIFLRLPDMSGSAYRRIMGLIRIFFEEANAEIVLYNNAEKKYIKVTGTRLRTSRIVVETMKKILGEENVILR